MIVAMPDSAADSAIAYYGVDAFTTQPFTGNPAAVCLLEGPMEKTWMQQIAAELAQPTTAFTYLTGGTRQLRWFTPSAELPLCGQPTLAAAHVLYEIGAAGPDAAVAFATPGGTLEVRRRDGRLWLELPAVALTEAAVPAAALTALNVDAEHVLWFGRSSYEFVLVLDLPDRVEQLRPDFARVRALPVPRTIVTAAGGTDGDHVDFTSRVFVPAVGLDEDAVTGSAHAVLAPLWARRLGRDEFCAVQASTRRGELALLVQDEQVHIGGHAITVTQGQLERRQAQRQDQ
jgi:PhzF family phenazine biosynthesis protein